MALFTGSKILLKGQPALLYNAEYTLERNDGYRIRFKAVPPYIGYGYSIQAWSILCCRSDCILFSEGLNG